MSTAEAVNGSRDVEDEEAEDDSDDEVFGSSVLTPAAANALRCFLQEVQWTKPELKLLFRAFRNNQEASRPGRPWWW